MRDNGIEYSDGLGFELGGSNSVADVGVKSLVDMKEGDLIATIPKQACITMLTTAASSVLEEAEIGGGLGLAVALMYERRLQERSKWYGYLQLLPTTQNLPFLWTPEEIDELLRGTELHQVIREDRVLMEEDWKESIVPLTELNPEEFPEEWFGLDQYLAAKTLVSSRAFEVDEYHGYGMVPLADLFNHKTADEDVHITNFSSDSEDDADSVETEGTPPSTLALRNGRKRNVHAHLEEEQEENCWKVGKSSNLKRKVFRDAGQPDPEDLQPQLLINQDGSVQTRRTRGQKSKPLEQKNDRKPMIHDAGQSPTDGVIKNPRGKKSQLATDELGTNKFSEKPRSRKKVKAKKPTIQVAGLGQVSDGTDKSKTQQSDMKKVRHRKEMEVEVQVSTNGQNFDRRRGKRLLLEEQSNLDSTVSRSIRKGGKSEKVEKPVNAVNPKEDYQVTQQHNGQQRIRQKGTKEPETHSSHRAEDILEMILVKNVAAGSEVFNTYGTLSNAALLHRYGFTEPNNPFDIVNIDLSLVVDSFGEAHTSRYVRRRLSKWRKVCCSPFDMQDSEYFEISAIGKPEEGLLMLMYMLNLADELFDNLSNMPDGSDGDNKIVTTACFLGWKSHPEELAVSERRRRESKGRSRELQKEKERKVDLETWLLTAPVCKTMLEVLRLRNGLYPTDSMETDEAMLSATNSLEQPERFHALRLRISERSILRKCETRVRSQLDVLRKSA